jgi:proteasome lid subunit RPN8/RPN11
MAPTVYVHRNAFGTMTAASVEMFKRECFGLLFGFPPSASRARFIITQAQSSQYPHKLHTGVLEHTRSERRLKEFFALMPKTSQPIGSFHSHTERSSTIYVPEMSDIDIKAMRDNKFKIVFIIGITSRKRGETEWHTNQDGSIIGSFGHNPYKYDFDIRAYMPNDEENQQTLQIKIIAPEAIRALNRAMGY